MEPLVRGLVVSPNQEMIEHVGCVLNNPPNEWVLGGNWKFDASLDGSQKGSGLLLNASHASLCQPVCGRFTRVGELKYGDKSRRL